MSASDARWRRLAELFDDLVDRDPDARAAQLAALRAEDAGLADELAAMLARDADGDGVLDHGLAAAARTLFDRVEASAGRLDAGAPGQRVGPFRLERLLGRGGMGEVWLARREEAGFEQPVALKLLKRGMDSGELVRRFARERRILARLEHPGIARLIDGGMSADGLPWFAMEYVDGEPITAYARARRLGVRERVELVARVCEAVAYAQARLVVHRDLKPSNLWVDREGRPRVLDFGIAKLLGDEGEDDARTGTGARVLSPAYAAPEQILGEPVGTATDVYALGLVLYELLTGRLPHRRQASTPEGLSQELSRETVERPSAALREEGTEGARDLARSRAAREVAGDLDTVVMAALRREPERRYAGAAALGDDLRRWLEGRPVAAQPDTARYRVAKFVRRHRGGVAAALLTTLALIAATGISLHQARRAQLAAERADLQAARAERVKDFVLALFREQDPLTRAQAKAATAGELVARGIAQAEADFATDPALAADVVGDLAQLQFSLGDIPQAREAFARVVERRRALDGEDSAAYGVALADLGGALLALGQREEAGPMIERAVALLRTHAGPEHIQTADAEMRLARLLMERGDTEAALPLAERVHAVYVRERGAEHVETLRRRYNVGVVLEQLDRLADAEATFRAVIAGHEARGEAGHLQLVYPRILLADILRRQRRYEEAEPLYRGAVDVARAELGDAHPIVGQGSMRLGDLLRRERRWAEAHAALDAAEAVFAPLGSPELGQTAIYRAAVFLGEERHADAVASYERAVAHYTRTLGAENQFTLGARIGLAEARARAGDVPRALREAGEAAAAMRRVARPDSFEAAYAAENLADVLDAAGRHAEALTEYREALRIHLAIYGPEHSGVASLEWSVAKQLQRLGEAPEEARALIDHALAVLRAEDDGHPDIGEALLVSARLAAAAGDTPRADREAAEARQRLERDYGPAHPLAREARALSGD